ncbi:LAFA_0D04654g1_1 [Lachancea sp. 'fantastica']|nr:LAFA_0D04654g1_1 [Lachancea sp. 'fantastica']
MPFSHPKPFAMVDDQRVGPEPNEHVVRRRSSSVKHALTSMIRSGSTNMARSGSTNMTSANSHPRSNSHIGIAPGASLAALHSSLMFHGGSPRLSHGCDDYGVAPNELALAENASRPVFSEDEYEEADTESGENFSESDELHSDFSFHTSKLPANLVSGRKYLLEYLGERGFLHPKVLSFNKDMNISLATSSEVVFLPTISSQDDEYLSHLAMLNGTETSLDRPDPSNHDENSSMVPNGQQSDSRNSGVADTRESTPIDADGKNVLFNLAVIVSFKSPTTVTKLKAELYSKVRVYWQHGVPPQKTTNEEYYTLGELQWDLTESNYNLYVPRNLSTKNKIVEQSETSIKSALFKNKADLATQGYTNRKDSNALLSASLDTSGREQTFQSGEYVFLLPVFFSCTIPETLYLPSGRVSYQFRCATKLSSTGPTHGDARSDTSSAHSAGSHVSEEQPAEPSSHTKFSSNKLLRKVRDQFQSATTDKNQVQKNLIRAEQTIQVVRIPPKISDFTADKPVYINRVWNDALSYEVSLLKKYVPAGSQVPIKIKLSPISKDISVKRIRVSVIEKITYVSKNLEYEFEQTEAIANDPYNPYYSEFVCRRKQERILPLWEIRSKEKGGRAIKEDVIDNCRSENLLSFSSIPSDTKTGGSSHDLVDPLVIESKISFPKFSMLDKKTSKAVPPYGIDEFTSGSQSHTASSGPLPRRNSAASGVIGFFAGRRANAPFASRRASTPSPFESDKSRTSFKSASNFKVNAHSRVNEPKRGLYLDCVSFKNIHVKHKLEIMLRISRKADEKSNAVKHYEVLIDTPIYIVSDLCGTSNIELPTYDVATRSQFPETVPPPSFEEAISVPGSPMASPFVSPVGTPNFVGSYEPDDLSIHQLSLSRATTHNHTSESPMLNTPHMERRYSNIDCLINANPGGPETNLFKEGFAFKHPMNGPGSVRGSQSDDDDPPGYET